MTSFRMTPFYDLINMIEPMNWSIPTESAVWRATRLRLA